MNKSLILVAGYPKSGSTWVRFVLEAMRANRLVSINEMEGYYGARRRLLFDELAPVNAGELTPEEIDDFLPRVFRALAGRPGNPHIVKVHDAAFRNRAGQWLYPPETIRAAIYLTRHPFDVAVSYAHHIGEGVQETIAHMGGDEIVAVSARRLRMPLHERVGSWSGNVASWLDAPDYAPLWVRYEDVYADPVAAFSRIAEAARFRADAKVIAQICDAARFERMQQEERAHGFSERPRSSPAFFRAGKPLSWEGRLDEDSRARLVADHGAVMERLGYRADGTTAPIA